MVVRAVLILVALYLIALAGLSQCSGRHPPVTGRPATSGERLTARLVRVVDGDTVDLGAERVRLRAIDAPETGSAHCPAERRAGLAASAEVTRLLQDGRDVTLTRGSPARDRYGRTLADVAVDGQDIGRHLVDRGLALPWRPGASAKAERIAHWCGPGAW